jgi:hypothetical protein
LGWEVAGQGCYPEEQDYRNCEADEVGAFEAVLACSGWGGCPSE